MLAIQQPNSTVSLGFLPAASPYLQASQCLWCLRAFQEHCSLLEQEDARCSCLGRVTRGSLAQLLLAWPLQEKPREDGDEACLWGKPRNNGLARRRLTPVVKRDPLTFLSLDSPVSAPHQCGQPGLRHPGWNQGGALRAWHPELGELGFPPKGGDIGRAPCPPTRWDREPIAENSTSPTVFWFPSTERTLSMILFSSLS